MCGVLSPLAIFVHRIPKYAEKENLYDIRLDNCQDKANQGTSLAE